MSKGIFDLNADRTIRSHEMLRGTYTPSDPMHRRQQIQQLAQIMRPLLLGDTIEQIVVTGPSASGKSLVARVVVAEFNRVAQENQIKARAIIIDGAQATTYRVLAAMANQFIPEPVNRVPYTGWSVPAVAGALSQAAASFGGPIVAILDGVDRRIAAEVAHHKPDSVNLILVAREPVPDFGRAIVCDGYNQEQIKAIVQHRVDAAIWPLRTIEGVAEAIASHVSDVRSALAMLSHAANAAEGERAVLSPEHVHRAAEAAHLDATLRAIKDLVESHRDVLLAVALATESEPVQTTGEVYTRYLQVAEAVGSEPLTQRRVTDVFEVLAQVDLVHCKIKSMGKYGRTKLVSMAAKSSAVKSVLLSLEGGEKYAKAMNANANPLAIMIENEPAKIEGVEQHATEIGPRA